MIINVNGNSYTVQKDMKLIEFLRDELKLKGTKNGCGEGACGTCTVIIDGRAVKACTQKLSRLEGKKIVTIEGLTEREQEVYAYSFAECGAVQCGFCIPGMVMCAKALIDSNDDPTREDVKKAIRGNICRCTGYIKIEDAILMAAWYFREGKEVKLVKEEGKIGQRFRRLDAAAKALGRGVYVDDMEVEGMCHVSALRSPYPRCLIRKVDTTELEKDERCIGIVRPEDIPNNIHGHITPDWPVLVPEGHITNYIGDALILIATYDKNAMDELKALVKVDAEELPGVYDAETGLDTDIIVHEGMDTNVYREENIVRGDIDRAFSEADIIFRKTYTTPFTEHAFMEPECALAMPDMKDGIRIYTSSQSVYDEQREIARMLRLDQEKIHVTSCLVGGGFGGKEDMSVQHHAALAAWVLKRPCKVLFTREESLMVHPKRHPMKMALELALKNDGTFLGLKEDIIADTGAYASLGGPVLQRACTHAGGPYNYSNLRVRGRAVYTNNTPAGAFRGFGVTQSCFAMESAIDEVAGMVGLDPWQIRMKNCIHPGQSLPNGQIAGPDTGLEECLLAVKDFYYSAKNTGLACCFKNAGIGMGIPDYGRCIMSIEQGKLHIRSSASCMGQGFKTVAVQVANEVLSLDSSVYVVEEPDTARCPDAGTSTASRQTAFTGEAVRMAANQVRKAMAEAGSLEALEGKEFHAEFNPPTDPLNSTKDHPVSHLAYSFSAQVASLEDNGQLAKIVAACDAGTVINVQAMEGQIEGGVVTGIGYGLRENFRLENGRLKSRLGTLGLFRANEVPEIVPVSVHAEGKSGSTFGAKGVGELTAIPTAPAIRNAYYRLDGIARTELPLEHTFYRK